MPNDRLRAPRWEAQMRAAVMATSSGQPEDVLEGTAENASLEGVCVRLSAALPKGTQVDVSLDGAPATAGTVRWILTEGEGKYLHGINYHIRLKRRALCARPFRRWWFRRWLRRGLMALISLAIMALAAYAVVSLVESLQTYDPWKKFYEPKGAERERYELQRRDEEMKRQGRP